MKKFYIGFLSLFTLTISSCTFLKEKEKPADIQEEFIPVTEIQLSVTSVELRVGESFKIEAKVLPNNATNKNIKWSVNDQGRIEFFSSTGLIEGLKAGQATIRAMSEQNRNIYIDCEVNVYEGQAPTQHVNYIYDNYTRDFGSEYIAHIDSCPSRGTPKLLIIPIWFDDSNRFIQESKRDNIITDINTAYFGEKGSTGWHSVTSFYQTESKGKCNLTGDVSPWYECGKSSDYYSTDNTGKKKTAALVKEAADYYFKHHANETASDFDTNNDGYLDGVILIYGAPDYKQLGNDTSKSNLWAYCHWIQEDVIPSKAIPNSFFWASYDFMYDANRALGRVGNGYGSGSCKNVTLDTHTFIHEAGHLFGLEDYYCYNHMAYPAGAFSMQDYNVGGHDPFSLFSLGWLNPFYPRESCEITLKPFQDGNHQSILLTPSFNMYASAFDEYLLLEFYTPTGLNKLDVDYQYTNDSPKGIDAYGIRLWHVDARLTYSKYKNTEGAWIYSTELITSPEEYKNQSSFSIRTAMTNTYYSTDPSNNNSYCSPLKEGYYQYNLLELIRKQAPNNELPKTIFDSASLYMEGDEFDISTHPQFKNNGLLNSGKELGYKFRVKSITSGEQPEAVVEIIKL